MEPALTIKIGHAGSFIVQIAVIRIIRWEPSSDKESLWIFTVAFPEASQIYDELAAVTPAVPDESPPIFLVPSEVKAGTGAVSGDYLFEGVAHHCPEQSWGIFRRQTIGHFQPFAIFPFEEKKTSTSSLNWKATFENDNTEHPIMAVRAKIMMRRPFVIRWSPQSAGLALQRICR